jgi:prophage regulatory protein
MQSSRHRHVAAPADAPIPALLRMPTVMHLTGLGRSTIYRMIAERRFPQPVRLGTRAVAWRRDDLDRWSETRPVATH